MPRYVCVQEFVIPAEHGGACRVNKRQILRIHQIGGQQAADCAFFNADDAEEHFGNCAGRCSTKLLAARDKRTGVRSCQENLAEALAPFGIDGDDIGDVFNAFMNVDFHNDGGFTIKVPNNKASDYLDLRAEMNIIAAVSACPNRTGPVNNFATKPLGIKVFDVVPD